MIVAHRLLKRVRDVAAVTKAKAINKDVASDALGRLDVDFMGLDAMDKKYLVCIARNYLGGPVGIETIAAALSEPRDAIEEIIEPYLIQIGLIQRTPRGRVLTISAFKHLNIEAPKSFQSELGLD